MSSILEELSLNDIIYIKELLNKYNFSLNGLHYFYNRLDFLSNIENEKIKNFFEYIRLYNKDLEIFDILKEVENFKKSNFIY